MSIAAVARIASVTLLAAVAVLPSAPVLAKTLPSYEVTANGTWDCRDPAGTFVGTIVIADESYAFMNTDGTLGGYGKLHLLSFDTHLPNFAVMSGYLKEHGSGAIGMTGPKENFEDISGELFLIVAVSTDRTQSWYCTGRHLPAELM